MKAQGWLRKMWQEVGASSRYREDRGGVLDDFGGDYSASGSVLRGLTGRSMEMAEVQAEVAAECHGQILVAGCCDEAVRRLLAHARRQPLVPSAGPVYREGFFTLLKLPDTTADRGQPGADGIGAETGWATEEWLELGGEADVLLYVFRGDTGWQADDARWYARLHATGLPLVLVEADLTSDSLGGACPPPGPLPGGAGRKSAAALPAGDRAVQVRLAGTIEYSGELPADIVALVERILVQRPKLGIPLAQEIPGCRPLIAQRAIRSGMLMTTLLGAEPIPLLDLPMQVALNWKLALQLAAIYGHPGLDHRSREMVGTVLWNLTLRYVIQQIVKLAPVLGWVASAVLSGAGTWALGNALVRYYQVEGQSGIGDWGSGIRGQGAGARWQAAKRRGQAAIGELQGTTTQWRQDAATRYAGLTGRLAAKRAALGRRRVRVTPT